MRRFSNISSNGMFWLIAVIITDLYYSLQKKYSAYFKEKPSFERVHWSEIYLRKRYISHRDLSGRALDISERRDRCYFETCRPLQQRSEQLHFVVLLEWFSIASYFRAAVPVSLNLNLGFVLRHNSQTQHQNRILQWK